MASNGNTGLGSLISGGVHGLSSLFKGAPKTIRTKTDKPRPESIFGAYPRSESLDKRICWLVEQNYREGSFEKVQFARKWMRNALIYQGYHELEWSEINVAWDVLNQDSGDYAFPNNYYRSLILYGVKSYVSQESIIEPTPANDDQDAQGAAKAAKGALEIIKKTVKYDYLRVLEGINLRVMGNSFRFAYYSKDPRYGYATSQVFQNTDIILSHGGSICPIDGQIEGRFATCPYCGSQITGFTPPIVSSVPQVVGNVKYPKGEVMTEVVSPLEMYMRSSSYYLWNVPFLTRARPVDRLALQSAFPDVNINPSGSEGGGEAYSSGGDLGLIYLQSLADLPGDPTQYAAWYERATAAAKAILIESWLRPSQYFFDGELREKFPDGLYGAKTGDTLLDSKNDVIEDHWTHYPFIPVPGRIWGDGDDDLIPGTLKLDEVDRLISRNQGYNAIPLIAIDSQRIDKNDMISDPSTIVEVKSAGRPVHEAWDTIEAQALPQETWNWRGAQIADMQFHAKISPTSVGQHEPGVNTFGGQESSAAKSDSALIPQLMLWKEADASWARQVLKLAAENWLDERVNAVEGINGRYEFEKLRGSALNLDKIHIVTRVLPIDPAQQESLSQAVASGLLNPQDPRVQRKAMQLYHLPMELDSFYKDAKVQWKEIEKMKQNAKQVDPQQMQQYQQAAQMAQLMGAQPPPMPGQIQPTLIKDNDAVHIDICREWLNSDEADTDPQTAALVLQHAQLHVMNMAKQQQMAAAISSAGAQAQNQVQPQPPPGQLPPGGKQPAGVEEPKQPKGGQVPKNPVKRQQRAMKGAAAKPNRPQPSEGNQYNRRRLT